MDLNNITLDHPLFLLKKQVLKLCKPLFAHTSVSFFNYDRFYFDGAAISLNHSPDMGYEVCK